MLLILVRPIDHIFTNVENATAIDEKSVEPEMKRRFPIVLKLYSHIIVNKKVVIAPNAEVEI